MPSGDNSRTPPERARQALSFGPVADLYDRARPGYPAEAVADALGPRALRVLDIGAGTGKLTRVLVSAGHDVVAVDPSPDMLTVLGDALPAVERRTGTAEATGLPDADVDAVVAAQAFHWFNVPASAHEFARVLRPGGLVALFWNVRDDSTGWVREYDALVERVRSHEPDYVPDLGPLFEQPTVRFYRHEQQLSVDDLVALARSRSYVLSVPSEQRAQILADVRTLGEQAAAEAAPSDQRDPTPLLLGYELQVWTARLRLS